MDRTALIHVKAVTACDRAPDSVRKIDSVEGRVMLGSLFPLIYGALFVALLWQAFRVMSKGFRAASGPISQAPSRDANDRTGQVTVHPELLDSEGRITEEDLLTVRFGSDDDEASRAEGPGAE